MDTSYILEWLTDVLRPQDKLVLRNALDGLDWFYEENCLSEVELCLPCALYVSGSTLHDMATVLSCLGLLSTFSLKPLRPIGFCESTSTGVRFGCTGIPVTVALRLLSTSQLSRDLCALIAVGPQSAAPEGHWDVEDVVRHANIVFVPGPFQLGIETIVGRRSS